MSVAGAAMPSALPAHPSNSVAAPPPASTRVPAPVASDETVDQLAASGRSMSRNSELFAVVVGWMGG